MAPVPPRVIGLLLLATLMICSGNAEDQQCMRSVRKKREWIIPPMKILENVDFTDYKSIAKIQSDKILTAPVRYSLRGVGADKHPLNVFIVDEITGFVRITRKLDREEISKYRLEGAAIFLNGTLAENTLYLNIDVEDENDNPPTFTKCSGSIAESSKPGTFVMQVNATDADEPGTLHTKIAYSIVEQRPPDIGHMFRLEKSGNLYVKEPSLDREKHSSYTLIVKGVDMDGAPNGNTGTGTVEVKILDINDNVPTLEKDKYEATIDENTANMEVLRMKVLDNDLENTKNWLALFEIVSGNEDGIFSIETDPKTNEGMLVLNKPVDYETVNELELGIAVRNVAAFHVPDTAGAEAGAAMGGGAEGGAGTGGETGAGEGTGGGAEGGTSVIMRPGSTGAGSKSYTVKINVRNLPDGPGFNPRVKPIQISEDPKALRVSSVIAKFPATDGDTGKPAENVRYAKVYDPDNWISVDEKTAEIKINKHPDRESKFLTNGTYYAKIICMTEDLPSKTATGTIALQVQDANDHCPQLTSTYQSLCSGERLVNVTAVDEDLNPNGAPFEFIIIPEDTSGKWEVEPYNDTSAILKPHGSLWPGSFKVTLEIKDNQGTACPDKQVLQLEVCTCTEVGSCTIRGAQGSSAKFSFSGIGILLLGPFLLLLVPLLLLFCTCRGSDEGAIMGDFADMPFDTKDYLIAYHTEGMGEDKEVPLLSSPVSIPTEQVFADCFSKTSAVRTCSPVDMYSTGQRDSFNKAPIGTDFDLRRVSAQWNYVSTDACEILDLSGDIYSEITLPEAYLNDYYSQKASCAARAAANLDSFIAYDYEGVDSPAGSVGCCSLSESDNNLDFLNNLDPKFMTLAQICRSTEDEAEVSTCAAKSLDEQRTVKTHAEINRESVVTADTMHHSTVSSPLSNPVEKVAETSCSATFTDMHVQKQVILPCQPYLIQQPVYCGTTPMLQTTQYILEPQVHNTLLVSELPSVPKMQTVYLVDDVAGSENLAAKEKNVLVGSNGHGGVFLVQQGTLNMGDNVILGERNISDLVVQKGNTALNQSLPSTKILPEPHNVVLVEGQLGTGQVLQHPLLIQQGSVQKADNLVPQQVVLVERSIIQDVTPGLTPGAKSTGGLFSDNFLLVDRPDAMQMLQESPVSTKSVMDMSNKENRLQDRREMGVMQEQSQGSASPVYQTEPSLASQDLLQKEKLCELQHVIQVQKYEGTEQNDEDVLELTTPVHETESQVSGMLDPNVLALTQDNGGNVKLPSSPGQKVTENESIASQKADENIPEPVPENTETLNVCSDSHLIAAEYVSKLVQEPSEEELSDACNKNKDNSPQISEEETAGHELLEPNCLEKHNVSDESLEVDILDAITDPDSSRFESEEENGLVNQGTMEEEVLCSAQFEELPKSREDVYEATEDDEDMEAFNSETDELEDSNVFAHKIIKMDVSSVETQNTKVINAEVYVHQNEEENSSELTAITSQNVELSTSGSGDEVTPSTIVGENIYHGHTKPLLEAELSWSENIMDEDASGVIERKIDEEKLGALQDEEMDKMGLTSSHALHSCSSQAMEEDCGGKMEGISMQFLEDNTSDSVLQNANYEKTDITSDMILQEPVSELNQRTFQESESSGSSKELQISEETDLLESVVISGQILESDVPVSYTVGITDIHDNSAQVAEVETLISKGTVKQGDLSSTNSEEEEEEEKYSDESAVQEDPHQVIEGDKEGLSSSEDEEPETCQVVSYRRVMVDEQRTEVESLEITESSESDSNEIVERNSTLTIQTCEIEPDSSEESDDGYSQADGKHVSGLITLTEESTVQKGSRQVTEGDKEEGLSSSEDEEPETCQVVSCRRVMVDEQRTEVESLEITESSESDSNEIVGRNSMLTIQTCEKEPDSSEESDDGYSQADGKHVSGLITLTEESTVQEGSRQETEGDKEEGLSSSEDEEPETFQVVSCRRVKVDEQRTEVESLEITESSESDSNEIVERNSRLTIRRCEKEPDSSEESDDGYSQADGKHVSGLITLTEESTVQEGSRQETEGDKEEGLSSSEDEEPETFQVVSCRRVMVDEQRTEVESLEITESSESDSNEIVERNSRLTIRRCEKEPDSSEESDDGYSQADGKHVSGLITLTEESTVQEGSRQETEGDKEEGLSSSEDEEPETCQVVSCRRVKVDEQRTEVESLEITESSESDSNKIVGENSMLTIRRCEIEPDSSQESDGGYSQAVGKHVSGSHYTETVEIKADSLQTGEMDPPYFAEDDNRTETEIEGSGSADTYTRSYQEYEREYEWSAEGSQKGEMSVSPSEQSKETVGAQIVNMEEVDERKLRKSVKRSKSKNKKLVSPTRRCSQQ